MVHTGKLNYEETKCESRETLVFLGFFRKSTIPGCFDSIDGIAVMFVDSTKSSDLVCTSVYLVVYLCVQCVPVCIYLCTSVYSDVYLRI